jgi:hypothetical protein
MLLRSSCPRSLWTIAQGKLDQINRVQEIGELAISLANRLESLRGSSGKISYMLQKRITRCSTIIIHNRNIPGLEI